ncbi:ubiquitin-associated and SH3 domain-containing protein A-like [Cucurbita maxima]|uniref:Ubiquitin-associated and SH3 domain-containing protein A-like n=1 Tax=Cucurbita maxima TaxID=3661 RepID=A0A6J1IE93_CUCMA|nr:ubiquitin-associated and SH3 domain-containing protein A-like [Cucurbita maxima]XP_022975446.1 ubiquitin-associated and SH3 domain-containing protein A-like [Cucurbita maxima]
MSISDIDAVPNGHLEAPEFYQNVVVMRHGDRFDNFERSWTATASRPWDPPLYKDGLVRAFDTGRSFLDLLGFPFHGVFVSPFLRCVQTAAQVIEALSDGADSNSSSPKVSIEYGLCEMLTNEAIRPNVEPKDRNWDFNIPQLEAILPVGTVDHSIERVYKEMLPWEGSAAVTHRRYVQLFHTLADKYPTENLLLVTHGEAVGVAVSTFMEDVLVYGVEYCAFVQLQRPVFRRGDSYVFGKFEVKLRNDGKDGIKHMPKPEKE